MVSKLTCNLNTFCVLTTKASRAKIWYLSPSPVACSLLSILRGEICLDDTLFIFYCLLFIVYFHCLSGFCVWPLVLLVNTLCPRFAITLMGKRKPVVLL